MACDLKTPKQARNWVLHAPHVSHTLLQVGLSGHFLMDLPTLRELDLETELRKRDAQVAELTVRRSSARRRYPSTHVDTLYL